MEDNDPVVREIPVFLATDLSDALHLVQYPLFSSERTADAHEPAEPPLPSKARIRPNHGRVELDVEINGAHGSGMSHYDEEAADRQRIDVHKFSSSLQPIQAHLAIGAMRKGELHLTPVKRILQMRASLAHIDAADDQEKKDDEKRPEEKTREDLFGFYQESAPTIPRAVARDMEKKLKAIDSHQAMGIPDHTRKWFVCHMMRQASANNGAMAATLRDFEKKLEVLVDQTECPVCLEPFTERGAHAPETLGCCHKVCSDCWSHWTQVMNGNPFCPLCRHDAFVDVLAGRAAHS